MFSVRGSTINFLPSSFFSLSLPSLSLFLSFSSFSPILPGRVPHWKNNATARRRGRRRRRTRKKKRKRDCSGPGG
jgi:hypothetical protein